MGLGTLLGTCKNHPEVPCNLGLTWAPEVGKT